MEIMYKLKIRNSKAKVNKPNEKCFLYHMNTVISS